ncbi:biopolymer transport protein ExbD/TolR [Pandoraea thiooxydans]|uniref:Biopolymer transporter ExbD n=1 Tax=Pandoraea thiooxydans TaxID=445709 RepID=A0A0G3EXG1_9BURK|nr:biopolymer transporter ExbD [Pandoraea thiooxydans]AKJ70087.1 biopolymer transporter ExbD [Pandoraea thiooxydans]APR93511.1 biopolymer transport protein ExbD/TolR [Pandoraea thiooxydans]
MNFRRGLEKAEPEINLIPLIDVLLVILIFLMITTTYTKYTALKVTLPVADANKALPVPEKIVVSVSADGAYAIDRRVLSGTTPAALNTALKQAADVARSRANGAEPVLIINADAQSTHQAVINVMEAARLAGLSHLTFATRANQGAGP